MEGGNLSRFIAVLVVCSLMLQTTRTQNPSCVRVTNEEPAAHNLGQSVKTPASSKPAHPCTRDCTGSVPMVCEYRMEVGYYYTMAKACYDCPCNQADCFREQCATADGVPRMLITANRTIPGPAIEVCYGDQVVVDVVNDMANGEGVTLHWHGLYMEDNQYMDGVFMVTMCPIPPMTSFRYFFRAAHPGTHWWHAHTGMQRADGLFGALIVRQADDVYPHRALYDEDLPEHKLMVNDWLHKGTPDIFLDHHFRGTDDNPATILINGKGRIAVYEALDGGKHATPWDVLEVEKGKAYRFRVVSSGITNIPMKVSVDGHNMTLIETDGEPFEPIEVDAFYMFGGERYDFILNASQEVGNYWLKIKGYKQGHSARGLAIIRYAGANASNPTEDPTIDRQGKIYQDMQQAYVTPDAVTTVNELKALENTSLPQDGKRTVYVAFDLNYVNNPKYHEAALYPLGPTGPGWGDHSLPQFNHQTFTYQHYPLFTQYDEVLNAGDLCEIDDVDWAKCTAEFCSCTQVIQVALNQTLEIVLIDESKSEFEIEHPFHMHGYSFRIVAQGLVEAGNTTRRDQVIALDKAGSIVRNFNNPPGKDTVIVPAAGYTVLQIVADNPGWWLLHCHMEFHLEDGMGLVVRVGNQSDLPPIPADFPKCNDYIPSAASPIVPEPEEIPNLTSPSSSSFPSVVVIIILAVIVAILLLVVVVLAIIVCQRGQGGGKDGRGKAQSVPTTEPPAGNEMSEL